MSSFRDSKSAVKVNSLRLLIKVIMHLIKRHIVHEFGPAVQKYICVILTRLYTLKPARS